MSQGNSIFSNPASSNGSAPNNPFASLTQKAAAPFAAAPGSSEEEASKGLQSPFGFADEENAQAEQTRLPEKRASESEAPQAKPVSNQAGNPFSSAGSTATFQKGAEQASPFSPSVGFEAEPAEREGADRPGENLREAPVQKPAASAPAYSEPRPQAASYTPASQASVPAAGRGQSTRQLELRAIFGVEGEMSREQILQLARDLPGIRELSVVGAGEMNAIDTLGEVMSRFGYGENSSWQISCSGGVVDFISADNTTLAILREGRYPAGVWEKLMIVARELGRLN